MRIAIIGGGFTGLSAAVRLVDSGKEVVVFESADSLGGLAGCFKPKHWNWCLENYYHHIFTNDKDIIAMAEKVGEPAKFKVPVTTSFIKGKEIQLDTPISLLKFSELSVLSRIRMGAGLLILKLIPNGVFLERFRVVKFLPWLLGKEGYREIWEKLMKAKFGPYVNQINMAWFWSRVAKRTKSLGYFDGSFLRLLEAMGKYVQTKGGEVRLGRAVKGVEKKSEGWMVDGESFDGVIITTPAPITQKIAPNSGVRWPVLDYLWGQTLVLELKNKVIDGYWMNILEKNWPFLVAVEHTNFIDKKNYGGDVVMYLGNYLPDGDKRLEMKEDDLLELFLPYLKKINPGFEKSWVRNMWTFKAPYAQPVFPINYSGKVPGLKTKQEGLYVANMSMVYPNDRGTNYAVKMGNDVADLVLREL